MKSSNLAVVVVEVEVAVVATDPRPATNVVVARPVVDARAPNSSSTTVSSQLYEQSEVNHDIKKVTVKCLRHCMSYYANDQSCFKSHCLSLG